MPGDTAARDDRELIRRSAAGDRLAFDEFVSRHQAAVFRFARALADADADAEDALQETFLNAWRHASAFRGEASPRTWLLAIARHAAFRLHRRRQDEPTQLEPLGDLGAAAGWGAETPEALALTREGRDLLARALDALSVTDREVVILRDVEEIPGEDVAAMLGLTLPAMKTRLHRARLRLAAKVKEAYGGA
jgi:RNA polymerase sigma-70 factor (ECF subfamily)